MKFLAILFSLLILMIGTKLAAGTYEKYFVTGPVGRDWENFAVIPWSQIQHGTSPFAYSYGLVLLAATGLTYPGLVIASIIGLFLLIFLLIKNNASRIIAFLVFVTFLFGVPMGKAIEAGNPDLILAVVFGIILWLVQKKRSLPASLILGLLLGFILTVKGFLLPIVLTVLIFSWWDIPVLVSFFISFSATSLWPALFGLHPGILSSLTFAVGASELEGSTILSQVHYGNIALVPYISNVLFAVENGLLPTGFHQIITVILAVGTAILLFVKPFFDEHIKKIPKGSSMTFPFMLLVITFCYIIMLTGTTWAYDYRIVYVLPILYCLLNEIRDRHTTMLLNTAIVLLLIKSLYIPKDRIMTLFLYVHFYFLLRAALSLWKNRLRFV